MAEIIATIVEQIDYVDENSKRLFASVVEQVDHVDTNSSRLAAGIYLMIEHKDFHASLVVEDAYHAVTGNDFSITFHRISLDLLPSSSAANVLCANNLEEVHMIAGDEQEFTYSISDDFGTPVDLTGMTCSILLFKHGFPHTLLMTLEGIVTGSPVGQFTALFPSGSSAGLQGVYQQQIKVIDYLGVTHIPSQGKIVIFPKENLA